MRQDLQDIGHTTGTPQSQASPKGAYHTDFVLEKSIFNNIFEKDIRRVFIYKKAERLAKAIHLIAPAFAGSTSLRNRIDEIAIGLVDAALLPPHNGKTALSRELLALSSVLSIAHTGGMLSAMNAELISREAHALLREIASYEDPRLFLDETPSLSSIAKIMSSSTPKERITQQHTSEVGSRATKRHKGQKDRSPVSDKPHVKDRQESIIAAIKDKRKASIKDISTLIRNVSEKTIQRELGSLIEAGIVVKEGDRRWSRYSLA